MWDKYYSEQQYEEALSYHNNMIEGDDRYFALGNDYYRLWDYKNSAQAFSDIEGYRWLYNAGNAFFRFGEEVSSVDEKINFWERSLDFYQQSLDKNQTTEAQTNYDIVKKKLDELLEQQQQEDKQDENQQQDKQDENQQQENQTEETSWEESQDNAEESSDISEENQQTEWDQGNDSEQGGNTSQQPIPQPRWEQYQLWEWSQVPEITESEKASLQRYIDSLQEEEIRNQRYFNKSWNNSTSRDAFDAFFNQFGSFDNWGSGGEKDW